MNDLLSDSRIIATHSINMNVWGQHLFKVKMPKVVVTNGEIAGLQSNSVNVLIVWKGDDGLLHSTGYSGFILDSGIRIGSMHCVSESYNSSELSLVVATKQGKIVHKQKYTKNVKIKDFGNLK